MCVCCCFPMFFYSFWIRPQILPFVFNSIICPSSICCPLLYFLFLNSFRFSNLFLFCVFNFATKHFFIKVTSGVVRILVPMSYLIWRTSNSGGPPIRFVFNWFSEDLQFGFDCTPSSLAWSHTLGSLFAQPWNLRAGPTGHVKIFMVKNTANTGIFHW